MSQNRRLIDTIKSHFARKSSAQLQDIVQANDRKRWSVEALLAAGEVLQDRAAGRAQEPLVPEEQPHPPLSPDPYSLAFLTLGLFAGLSGLIIVPGSRTDDSEADDPDLPVPFGPRMAWLAVDCTDTAAVATALGFQGARAATWAQGMAAAGQGSVFITPPLGDWSLVVGTVLFPPDRAEAFAKPLLERLSRQFGDVQYFATHQDVELHLWARARKGRLVRGYGWLGEKGLLLWDEGALTKEERDLGFRFSDGQLSASPQSPGALPDLPDESCVLQLACLWSIDPTTLDHEHMGSVMGLVGQAAWAASRASP
jgi:hypothetical protein